MTNETNDRAFAAAKASTGELALTVVAIAVTLLAGATVTRELLLGFAHFASDGSWRALAGHLLFASIVFFLVYGGLVYQVTRLAYLVRRRRHRPASEQELDTLFAEDAPSLTVLVPSYKEEPGVVLLTLLAAALQDYPKRRVVLLIDDPPRPDDPADLDQLKAARRLPGEVADLLAWPAARMRNACASFRKHSALGDLDGAAEASRLAALYEEAADWFGSLVQRLRDHDHVERLFRERFVDAREHGLRRRAAALRELGLRGEASAARIEAEYRRVATLFTVEMSSFERKQYQNLSHEPNKAMNLNSYLGLLGGRFRQHCEGQASLLVPADDGPADLVVPGCDYVITLDADSIILPDYALRLVHLAERPENARLGVVQTPYSAFPGAPGALERTAGATTDIQYQIHQGFTSFGATFWVGANALLRLRALRDIATHGEERGHPVTRFIQDRTVIEDTESSIDLAERGWSLHNYPERLAYSATPPDFGSLVIQRRRWANGGLIILPKLLRYLWRSPKRLATLGEAFMRVHYLCSIAAVNVGLLVILAVPFVESLRSPWLPLTALPYFLLYARDLARCGYRARHVLDVYALNLLLIPVNLGGVLKSLQQAWTKAKIPFGRTPKVSGRTGAPALYVAAAYLLIVHWLMAATFDLLEQYWQHALFAAVNAGLLAYAIVRFIGLSESREDIALGWRKLLTARSRVRGAATATLRPASALSADAGHGTAPKRQEKKPAVARS